MMDLESIPFRDVEFAPRDIDIDRRDNGEIVLKPRMQLNTREPHLPAYLRRHSAARPDTHWLGQRRPVGGDWQMVSFGEAKDTVDRLTQALLNLAIEPGKALAILSENTIEHALISIACMQAGIPVAPISVAYSLKSKDFSRLREIMPVVNPGAIFVQVGGLFQPAIASLKLDGVPVIAYDDVQSGQLAYQDLVNTEPTEDVDRAFNNIETDSVARIMFTSGSTGTPKGVPQTHRNIVASGESNLQTNCDLEEGVFSRLDWTPWNHVMGATGLGLALIAGGTIKIDGGRPAPGLFQETVRNLKEESYKIFVSVPAAYPMLLEALEADEELAKVFFKELELVAYGGAALSSDVVKRLQKLAVKYTGCKISVGCGYGATETGPGGAFIYWSTDKTGLIGLPHTGFDLKLVPLEDDRFEVRIRGEGVMSGYIGRPDLNDKIFDAEGFYKIGDTVRFADPDDILEGLSFAGRMSEEFKLTTGTFVIVGALQMKLMAATSPLLSNIVVCGENQPYISIMAWLNIEAARKFVNKPDASLSELNRDPDIRAQITKSLVEHNKANPGISFSVKRYLLLDEPPSIDHNEVTDKGSINQRGVQQRRAKSVESLFLADITGEVVEVA